LIFIPNAFSPNGDGDNEFFFPVGSNAEFLEMRIYNRWGELLYTTTDIDAGWDGTFKGKEVPIGVYTWVVHYLDLEDKEQIASGNVSLLR
jgi:gliding motility-associated-like protein